MVNSVQYFDAKIVNYGFLKITIIVEIKLKIRHNRSPLRDA